MSKSESGAQKEIRDMKIYNKYKIEHTDGTPLKGKKFFVLRLDSDDPIEAARVARAMRAYDGKPRNCDVGTEEEQAERQKAYCRKHFTPDKVGGNCRKCPLKDRRGWSCQLAWAQTPYEDEEGGET